MVEGSSNSDLPRILGAIKSSEIVENRVQLFTELGNLDFKDISNFSTLVDGLTVSLTLATSSSQKLDAFICALELISAISDLTMRVFGIVIGTCFSIVIYGIRCKYVEEFCLNLCESGL